MKHARHSCLALVKLAQNNNQLVNLFVFLDSYVPWVFTNKIPSYHYLKSRFAFFKSRTGLDIKHPSLSNNATLELISRLLFVVTFSWMSDWHWHFLCSCYCSVRSKSSVFIAHLHHKKSAHEFACFHYDLSQIVCLISIQIENWKCGLFAHLYLRAFIISYRCQIVFTVGLVTNSSLRIRRWNEWYTFTSLLLWMKVCQSTGKILKKSLEFVMFFVPWSSIVRASGQVFPTETPQRDYSYS
jgi:hypothetical protein